ncbi:MAG TPA: MAPEG family protein, partial [Gammaproteobacteria bacterium]
MNTELMYLVWVTLLTAILWVPYVLNRFAVRGIADTVGYPSDPKPLAPWAERLKAAHGNAVENLVVFAALLLTA